MTQFDIKKFADEINSVDDQLAAFADYEGGEYGPTFRLWQEDAKHWAEHCERAIELHEKAAKLWRKGKRAGAYFGKEGGGE